MLRLTLDEGDDPIDGTPLNAVRRRALDLLDRTVDDLTDVELMGRMPDELWYLDLCIDGLGRLPSEVDPIILCREYTALQARGIVKRAMDESARPFVGKNKGPL